MIMKVPGFGSVLRLPVFGAVTLAGIGVGAVAGLVAYRNRRAIVVDATREGYRAKNAAAGAWASTKSYAAGVKAEALAPRASADLSGEVERLRKEVATLRAQLTPSTKK